MRRCALLPGGVLVAGAVALLAACSPSPSRHAGSSVPAVSPPAGVPSASRTPPPVLAACPAAARHALSVAARRPVSVASHAEVGLTTCDYRARPGGRCRLATVRVNTAPQAFVDFNRWVDEAVQNATVPGQTGLAPIELDAPALGVEVDWVPAHRRLDTGIPGRWVTVAVGCTLGDARERALARAIAATVTVR